MAALPLIQVNILGGVFDFSFPLYPTSSPSANIVDFTFQVYPESQNSLHLSHYGPDANHHFHLSFSSCLLTTSFQTLKFLLSVAARVILLNHKSNLVIPLLKIFWWLSIVVRVKSKVLGLK